MLPSLSCTNIPISIVLFLVPECIVYHQIMGICCEIFDILLLLVSYRTCIFPLLFAVVLKGYCLHIIDNSTCLQSFVHVCIQVVELQEHACPILMYGPKLFVFFKKGGV